MTARLDRGRAARRRRRRGPLPDRRRDRRPRRDPVPARHPRVNLGGAFALGLVAGAALHGQALVIVAGGGIGSFTTFSTWILDSHRLRESGLARAAWLNIGLSLVAGFLAVALGHWLGGVL